MDSPGLIDPDTERAVRRFVARLSGRYDLNGVILFGNRARRTCLRDSNADVAVLLRGSRGRFVSTKPATADVAQDVLPETDIRVQPLPMWEDEQEYPHSVDWSARISLRLSRRFGPVRQTGVDLTSYQIQQAHMVSPMKGENTRIPTKGDARWGIDKVQLQQGLSMAAFMEAPRNRGEMPRRAGRFALADGICPSGMRQLAPLHLRTQGAALLAVLEVPGADHGDVRHDLRGDQAPPRPQCC